jgi:outer membrane protein, heavy metal efflux system
MLHSWQALRSRWADLIAIKATSSGRKPNGYRRELIAEANRLERLRRLASLRAEADAARTRADALMAEVYPRTIKTLAQVREGYNRGGFTFRDVQDGADAILAVQEQWLGAMNQYRDTQTEIDRLTGRFDDAAAVEAKP